VSVETAYLSEPKLRLAWLWWAVGYVLIVLTIYESLEAHPTPIPGVTSDKFEHFMGYFLLTTWFCGCARRSKYWLVALGLLILGGGMEIGQGLMAIGREADWLDMLANSTGVLVGVGLALLGLGNWMQWVERLFRLQK
jgi:VanZ family protein